MKPLAIIPARGGSKRFPRKNVALLKGKSLLEWTIDVAKESGVFERVVVSSEDEEIISIAKKCGAEIHQRKDELASDTAQIKDVVESILKEYSEKGEKYDSFGLIIL